MYFNFYSRQMLNYSVTNCAVLYFIFTLNLCILCHTVVNSSDLLSSRSNESLSNEIKIGQLKREDKKQVNIEPENKSRNTSLSENKVVSPGINNITVHNKSSLEDQFNSTANLPTWMNIDENAFKRTGIVALGFMCIVLIFFVVKAVRLRRKKSKSRKYGIITSTASDMEMEPLDKDDDEEEDTTLFDAQHKYSLQ